MSNNSQKIDEHLAKISRFMCWICRNDTERDVIENLIAYHHGQIKILQTNTGYIRVPDIRLDNFYPNEYRTWIYPCS